jgi:hypothetical protein
MEKFIKFLYLKLVLVLLALPLGAEESLRFKGDYFLYSDELNYIYGGGNILLKAGTWQVKGNVLYMDVKQLSGVIYGDVRIRIHIQMQKKTKDFL